MAARKDKDQVTCQRCRKAIFGNALKHAVRLSTGDMHDTCWKEHWALVERTIADAVAAGTHKETDPCPTSPSTSARP